MATAGVLCGAATARATTLPCLPRGAVVRVGPTVDAATFTRAVAMRYHVVLQRVVTADIDRDGDLDVLSTTERGVLVWVNDGTGRLTSQTPRHRPFIDGTAPPDTWNGDRTRNDETIQDDVPSLQLPSESAHAPPASIGSTAASSDVTLHSSAPHFGSAPRAPPSAF
jgi:hypothetical protein